jgi:outer membrane protein TolC
LLRAWCGTRCALLRAVLAIPLALPSGAYAHTQESVPAPLTLDAAVARAIAVSHRLGEARAREEAARAVVDQREAAQLPTVSAQLGYQRTNHVDEYGFPTPTGFRVLYPDVPDNYRSRIELQWPIYTGGRLQALERAATAEAGASAKDLASARADLVLEVTRAYWALVTARESARVVQQGVERVEAQLADVRARFDAGFIPPSDVSSVEAQAAHQRMLLIEAQNLASSAELDLARLLDAPPGRTLTLDERLDVPPAPVAHDAGDLAAAARGARPDRAAHELRVQAAEDRQHAARAGSLPSVAIVSGVDYARPNPRIFPRIDEWRSSWDASVNATWTFWDNGRTRAEIAEAASAGRGARERLAELDSTIATEVRQRLLDVSSARAQIQAAEEGVRSAAEARRVLQERYAAGVATTTDLLDAQVALLQAELDRTRALANTRLAMARLDRALGR